MKNYQKDLLDVCNRVEDFNVLHNDILKDNPEYVIETGIFDKLMVEIRAASLLQAGNLASKRVVAMDCKKNMADTVILYADRGCVKAIQAENIELERKLSHAVGFIYEAAKTLAVDRALAMRNVLNDNLDVLTNISKSDIAEIDAVISTYDNVKDEPTNERQHRAAFGTDPLPAAFRKARKSMKSMYKLLRSHFGKTHTSLVVEFRLAKKVIVTGVRHNGVQGIVKKDGNVFIKAKASIPGTKKITYTDDKGYYLLTRLRQGTHTIEIRTETGEVASKKIRVKRGHIIDLDFELGEGSLNV